MVEWSYMIDGPALDSAGGSLLERDVALGVMMDTLGAVEQGGGAVLLLAGAAGIGKTSLMRAGRRAALQAGFRVGSAVGSPMESGLPFGLVGQALVELGGSDADDVLELQRLGDPSARLYRMFRWLANVAADAPLLLVLDDLHWADPDSLGLLGFLARRVSDSRIMVLGSLRAEPNEASALAYELAGAGQARVLELQPLSREASVALLQSGVPRVLDAAEGEGVWRACAGTPLLLKAAAWTLSSGGLLPRASGENGLGAPLLLERFVGVGGAAFAYVQAASILGVRFRSELAGALAGLAEAGAEGARAQLVRAGLLDDLGGGWAAFMHPLFAQALLEAQAPSERERAHAEAFRLLLDRGEPDAVAAEHAVLARLVGDPLAVEVAARAGRSALAQGALAAAVAHLQNALGLAGEEPADELLFDYASALAARGQVEAVEGVCGRLLARGDLDPAVRVHTLALLGRVAMLTGRPAQAERLYEQAASAAALLDCASEVATLMDAAMTCHVTSTIPWALQIISRALAVLPEAAPARRPLELLKASVSLTGGDPVGAELLAREISADRGDGDRGGWGYTMAVHALNVFKLLENLADATEVFEREFARAVQSGAPMLIGALAIAHADTVHRLGHPREALELMQRAMALSDLPANLPWVHVALAVLLSELGRDGEALPHIQALRTMQAGIPPQYNAVVSLWLDLIDARSLLEAGEPEQASQRMLHAAEIAQLTGWREPCVVPWASVGIQAHLAADRIDRARELVEDLEGLTKRLSCRWPRAVIELGHARLAAAEDRTEEADQRFHAALEIFAELGMPIFHAEALLDHGAYLRRSGRPRLAREPIAHSLELAEAAGAERVARLARAELAAAGGRRRRASGSRELTAQEQRVAACAADGMTNAQIAAALHLSPKTVGHHLQHVYSKLDIHSRRELIRRAHPPA